MVDRKVFGHKQRYCKCNTVSSTMNLWRASLLLLLLPVLTTESTTSESTTNVTSTSSPSTIDTNSQSYPVQSSNTSTSSQDTATTSNITASLPTSSPSSSSTVTSVQVISQSTTNTTSSQSTLSLSQTVQSSDISSSSQNTATTSNITASLPTSSPSSSSTLTTVTSVQVTSQSTNTASSQTTLSSNATASSPTTSNISVSTVASLSMSSPVTSTSSATLNSNSTISSLVTNISNSSENTTSSITTIKPSTISTMTSQAATTISTVAVPLEFKIINKNFTESLKNSSSFEFIDLKTNVEHEMKNIYSAKFSNFKAVKVKEFMKGSVIAVTDLEFNTSEISAPSNDDTVRALISSLKSNDSVGGLQLLPESISSNGVNVTALAPLNISISFLIKKPYNISNEGMLKTQANNWVNDSLLLLPNTTAAGNSSITFTNFSGWTNATMVFPIDTTNLFDANAALRNLISNRQLAGFTIIPDTLTVQGNSATFMIISQSLRLLNMNISQSIDLSMKSSPDFLQYSTAIEDSFKDIFRQQLIEPVVANFTYDPPAVNAAVNLYFQNDTVNKSTVITQLINNEGIFRNRGIILDLFQLDPKVGVRVTVTLIQDYTSSPSSDAIELQNKILNLLTTELRTFYDNSLQDPPLVSFTNAGELAAMTIQYKLNYSTNVVSSSVLTSILNNTGLTNSTRIASWSVNGVQQFFDTFIIRPRFINQVYAADLKDRNSTMFKDFERNITQGLNDILKKFNVKQIVVLSFQQGSVIGIVETVFAPETASYTQVTKAIVDNKNALANLNLVLDPQSLYTSPNVPTNPPPQSSVPGYGVAIIVMCILLILAIPIVIFLALKTDLCRKLSNACSLKTPYKRCHESAPSLSVYRTHYYNVS